MSSTFNFNYDNLRIFNNNLDFWCMIFQNFLSKFAEI